jgi:hypothetical protein
VDGEVGGNDRELVVGLDVLLEKVSDLLLTVVVEMVGLGHGVNLLGFVEAAFLALWGKAKFRTKPF